MPSRQAVHVGDELQKLTAGQFLVQVGLVGNVADQLAGPVALFFQIETADADGAGSGKEQPADQFDGRGLAGAVRAQKGEQFPGPDL